MATTFTYNGTKGTDKHANLNSMLWRGLPGPLDGSSVFTSLADFEYYLSKQLIDNGASDFIKNAHNYNPYVGQVVSVVTAGGVTLYKVTKCVFDKAEKEAIEAQLRAIDNGSGTTSEKEAAKEAILDNCIGYSNVEAATIEAALLSAGSAKNAEEVLRAGATDKNMPSAKLLLLLLDNMKNGEIDINSMTLVDNGKKWKLTIDEGNRTLAVTPDYELPPE